jgi:hypothetical protein
MDWMRRNWPDLAIGLALVAVIGGIVATLITGGSFFPTATTPTQVPSPTAAPPTLLQPVGPSEPGPVGDAPPRRKAPSPC